MSHRSLIRIAVSLASLILALPAHAASGMRLSWDHCAADGRVANKAFACDTNNGSELLVFSFDPPVAKTDCVGIEFVMHIKASETVMPAWWQLGTGGCRAGALVYSSSVAAAGTCTFPFGPTNAGGVAGFTADAIGPGSWRVLALTAVPATEVFSVTPGVEHFAMALSLRHTKTVGTGACGGCATPVCFGFGSLKIVDATNLDNIVMLAGHGNQGGSEEAVTWQGAYVREYIVVSERVGTFADLQCDPDNSSPARRSTWGAVKSLYH